MENEVEVDIARSGFGVGAMLERVFLGKREGLPQFIGRHHEGLIYAYQRCVGMLIESIIQFALSENGKVPPRVAALQKEFGSHQGPFLTPADLYARFETLLNIDAQLVAAMPAKFLVARRWLLIDRFRRIAPPRAFVEYESSFPPSTDKQKSGSAESIRADLLNLSNYVQQHYIINVQREKSLASIKWWLLTRAMALLAIIATIFWAISIVRPLGALWPMPPNLLIGLGLTFLTGMIGAIVSISRKFQDIAKNNVLIGDPFNEIVSLDSGRQSVAVSILSGGVFALLLYLLVVAGGATTLGLSAAVFPSTEAKVQVVQIQAEKKSGTCGEPKTVCEPVLQPRPIDPIAKASPGIAAISTAMGFYYAADILRMMLLAFLAGFAERLVPDSIDRLIKREKDAQRA